MLTINHITFKVDLDIVSNNSQYLSSLLETEDNVNVSLDIDCNILIDLINLISDEKFQINMEKINQYAYWFNYFMINPKLLYKIHPKVKLSLNPKIIKSVYQLNQSVFSDIFGDLNLKFFFKKCKLDDKYISLMSDIKLDTEHWLNLFKIWKKWIEPESKINDILLLKLYDYSKYLIYTPKKILVERKTIFKPGQLVITSFINKFEQLTCYILTDFDYTDVIIAGGAIHACVINKPFGITHTDIDIFITTESALQRILLFFSQKFRNKIIYAVNGYVITLCIVGVKRNFQLIYALGKSKYDIIGHFDFGYCQILYDGQNILCTDSCLTSLRTQTTCISSAYAKAVTTDLRYYKAFSKGYGINKKIKQMDTLWMYKYYYPSSINLREQFLVKSCFKAKRVLTDYTKVKYTSSGSTDYQVNRILDWNSLYQSININKEGLIKTTEGKNIVIQIYSPYFFVEESKQSFRDEKSYKPHYLKLVVDNKQIYNFFKKIDDKTNKMMNDQKIYKYNMFPSIMNKNINGYIKANWINISMSHFRLNEYSDGILLEENTLYSGHITLHIDKVWAVHKKDRDDYYNPIYPPLTEDGLVTVIKTLVKVQIKSERKYHQNTDYDHPSNRFMHTRDIAR